MVDSLLGSKSGKSSGITPGRLARTVVLGSVAVAFGIYWLARSYGADTDELLIYLKASMAFVAFFALIGIAGGVSIWLVRWLRRWLTRTRR